MYTLDMPACSASCSCVNFFSILLVFTFSAKLILSHLLSYLSLHRLDIILLFSFLSPILYLSSTVIAEIYKERKRYLSKIKYDLERWCDTIKLNLDCIRDILIVVESIEYGKDLTIPELQEKIPNYSKNELQYHCIKLVESNLLDASTTEFSGFKEIFRINDLTI